MNILILILGVIVNFKFIQSLFKVDNSKKNMLTLKKCYIYGFLCTVFYIWLFVTYPILFQIKPHVMML